MHFILPEIRPRLLRYLQDPGPSSIPSRRMEIAALTDRNTLDQKAPLPALPRLPTVLELTKPIQLY